MGAYVNGVKQLQSDSPAFTGSTNISDLYTSGKVYMGDASPLRTLNNGDAWIAGTGLFGKGMISETPSWGASLVTVPTGGFGSTSLGTCTYILTGGTYESMFTATPIGGWSFSSTDVGKVIVLLAGAHTGGVCVVDSIIDGTTAIVDTCGWDADISEATMFAMVNVTLSFTSPNLKINSIAATAEWENRALGHTGLYANRFYATAGGVGSANVRMETDTLGYANVDTLLLRHTVGTLAAGALQKAIRITVDDSGCIAGSTAEIDTMKFVRVQGSSTATVHAMDVGTGFSEAVHVDGSPEINPGYGYTFTAAYAVTDHVNSTGGGNNSFINPSINTQMFPVRYSGIMIGYDSIFSVIECILSIVANASINPTFQYSTGDGTWATLSISDTTIGFTHSGKMAFTPPANWAKTAHCNGSTGAVTNAYYVRITRNVNSLSTPPTELYFKIYEGASSSSSSFRGDGTVKPVQMADASAPNDSIYYSLTANALVYKTTAGAVHALY